MLTLITVMLLLVLMFLESIIIDRTWLIGKCEIRDKTRSKIGECDEKKLHTVVKGSMISSIVFLVVISMIILSMFGMISMWSSFSMKMWIGIAMSAFGIIGLIVAIVYHSMLLYKLRKYHLTDIPYSFDNLQTYLVATIIVEGVVAALFLLMTWQSRKYSSECSGMTLNLMYMGGGSSVPHHSHSHTHKSSSPGGLKNVLMLQRETLDEEDDEE